MCNEWLDCADLKVFEDMKKNNPRRYQVAGLGNWGITDGLVYENWNECVFTIDDVRKLNGVESVFGLHFGYTNDPTALFCGFIDINNKVLYVFDEMYEKEKGHQAWDYYEKSAKNKTADAEQYKKYKAVLGKNAPKSLE